MLLKRMVPSLAAAAIMGLGLWTLVALDRAWTASRLFEQRAEVTAELSVARSKLELELHKRVSGGLALVAVVADSPDLTQDEFSLAAGHVLKGSAGVRSLSLARNSVVSHVHPWAENQKALGLNLQTHPLQGEAVRRAMSERITVLSGPVDLVQGGRAFIARIPIFLDPLTEAYWGMGTVLIDSEQLLRSVLSPLQSDLRVAARGHDGTGQHGKWFYGEALARALKPVTCEVSVPGGSWQLAALPQSGWVTEPPDAGFRRGVGLFLTVSLSLLSFLVLSSRRRLREEIDAHKRAQEALHLKAQELSLALSEVKTLKGLLPICSQCKSIRNDQGIWDRMERYLATHSEVDVTHSICPTCVAELYGEEFAKEVMKDVLESR